MGTFLVSVLILIANTFIWYFWSRKELPSTDSSGERRPTNGNDGLMPNVEDPRVPGEDESPSQQDSDHRSSSSPPVAAIVGTQPSSPASDEAARAPISDSPTTIPTSFKQIASAVTMYVNLIALTVTDH
jgi:hypothetical protein